MITKKLNYKSPYLTNNSDKKYLYFDIETTGLQKKNALIYLIGCAYPDENEEWSIRQWFAENPDEEQQILELFSAFLSEFSGIAHYNGSKFDIPFVEFRCSLYQLPSPFIGKVSLDYYSLLRPCRQLLNLPGLKQTDLEAFLNFTRISNLTGKDCIKVYRDLIKYRDSSYALPLLEHNLDDLQGLICCCNLTSFLDIMHENCTLISTKCTYEDLFAELRLPSPVPVPYRWTFENFTFQAKGEIMSVSIHAPDGILKNYYANYKDYYYLPHEQTAVHKSVGTYVDKSRRQPASPDTCYTKFAVTESFLNSPEEIGKYIQRNIPVLLPLCR